jgi:hypothetical protein
MKSASLVVAGVVLLAVGACAAEHKMEESRTVTAEDLANVCKLTVVWAGIEAGTPAVMDLSGHGVKGVSTAAYRSAMLVVEVLMDLGELAPGHYEYDDPGEEVTGPFREHNLVKVNDHRIGIEVTADHLKLLRALRTEMVDDGGTQIGVMVNPKRPYGDMTYFELDMADILGIRPEGPPRKDQPKYREFTPAQLEKLGALHEQMQPVLQVFLQQAKLAPGQFVRKDTPDGQRFQRVTSLN